MLSFVADYYLNRLLLPGNMTIPTGLALLGTLAALLGVVSHLTIFTRIEWHMLAPLLVWVYSALAFLLFLLINSFESDLRTCLEYVFISVISYCIGLFSSVTIAESMRRRYRNVIQSGPEEIAIGSYSAAPDGLGITYEKAERKDATHWSGQGPEKEISSS